MFLRKRNLNKGFTLVELLVTISIFVVLTGVVLFNQSKFNSTILLTNLAYDTALTIRQAQTYGINIKEFNDGTGSESVFVPYGVHFDKKALTSFILFADIDYDVLNRVSNGIYDGNNNLDDIDPSLCQVNMGCVNRYSIKRGNSISNIEVVSGTATSTVDILDITFKRPNPDAIIYGKTDDQNSYTLYDKAIIYLVGVDGVSTRKVKVQANGLIEIVP